MKLADAYRLAEKFLDRNLQTSREEPVIFMTQITLEQNRTYHSQSSPSDLSVRDRVTHELNCHKRACRGLLSIDKEMVYGYAYDPNNKLHIGIKTDMLPEVDTAIVLLMAHHEQPELLLPKLEKFEEVAMVKISIARTILRRHCESLSTDS